MHFRSIKACWASRLGISHVYDVLCSLDRTGAGKRVGESESACPALENPNTGLRGVRKNLI